MLIFKKTQARVQLELSSILSQVTAALYRKFLKSHKSIHAADPFDFPVNRGVTDDYP
jgi:hypothetical protein